MTNEEAINTLNSLKQYYNDKNEDGYVGFDNEDNEALDLAIKALEQQPCEDCVSRQTLIDKATSWGTHFTDSERAVSLTDIMSLPSVTPQPKRGQWEVIRKEYEFMGGVVNESQGCKCSNCGEIVKFKSDFCPSCGADMRERGVIANECKTES